MDTKGERRGGMNWEISIDIYTLPHIKKVTNENLLYTALYSVLCGDLSGKEIQKSGDICIPIADSLG